MTKLPAKLFADFSPSGGLSRILCCALRYKKEKVVHAAYQCRGMEKACLLKLDAVPQCRSIDTCHAWLLSGVEA